MEISLSRGWFSICPKCANNLPICPLFSDWHLQRDKIYPVIWHQISKHIEVNIKYFLNSGRHSNYSPKFAGLWCSTTLRSGGAYKLYKLMFTFKAPFEDLLIEIFGGHIIHYFFKHRLIIFCAISWKTAESWRKISFETVSSQWLEPTRQV